MINTTAIIAAAGVGDRMGFDKILTELSGIPLLARTIMTISAVQEIQEIIVAVSSDKIDIVKENIIKKYQLDKVSKVVPGGKSRTETVWNAVQAIDTEPEIIAIHDGARPFVSKEAVLDSLKAASEYGGAILVDEVIPTIKKVNKDFEICETLDRNILRAAATPQSFRYKEYLNAYSLFLESDRKDMTVTDDAQIFELSGKIVKVINNNPENIKITTPFDWKIAEMMLSQKQ